LPVIDPYSCRRASRQPCPAYLMPHFGCFLLGVFAPKTLKLIVTVTRSHLS
jgi:hypothetical protein